MAVAIPNFFVVGAPTSGTTALYHFLWQHPAVYMSPIKEPRYFAPELIDYPGVRQYIAARAADVGAYLDGPMREPRHGYVREWDQYLKLFRLVREERAVGEASVCYLGSPVAPRAIRDRVPHARIIMLLRDPAECLFSTYATARAYRGTSLHFAAWAEAQAEREESHGRVEAVRGGRYAPQLRRYLDCFPRAQILICLYDDFAREPATVLRHVFSHLAVESNYPIDTSRRHNETRVPRWPTLYGPLTRPVRRIARALLPSEVRARAREWSLGRPRYALDPADRKRVIAIYAPEIEELETLIGRDLSAWLDPHRPHGQ